MSRTPTILTDKRAELAYERTQRISRISELDKHIEAPDYALQMVDWSTAARTPRCFQ